MPRWEGADEIMRLMNERGDFLRAAALLVDEDLRWVNKHLDLAFEGRHDHLRNGAPEWATNPPPPPPQHGLKRRLRIVEKSLAATFQGEGAIPTTIDTYAEPWCEACEQNYCTTEKVLAYSPHLLDHTY